MKNTSLSCLIPARSSFFYQAENAKTIHFDFEKYFVCSDRIPCCISVNSMIFFNRRRFPMISRKKIVNLFINYYINEDRNNVLTLLKTQASSSDFSDDLSALEKSKKIDIELVEKKKNDGSINALQKRQSYVMKDRIDAINERLRLEGNSLLTEKEIYLIHKNWPSIYQLVRESIEENSSNETSKPSVSSNTTSDFLQ
ncbi:hypothetical protein IQ235_14400 [Oscillatoriales cyanobacterium LEGE 11467]|uniref:Uncharacterized protein n=1 Tax=Zarconia navalis LEGE 11467 TaxID=1828826 RepID=A0A928W2F6_9CYAN|nr:hypothetical protein [Zarconia navalis]MBE9041970.1 hypothetical protein [Zarconia navalis LEGE 11467]